MFIIRVNNEISPAKYNEHIKMIYRWIEKIIGEF